ncbi:TonB-dependent receptor domain-containing protein [Alkalilimnicola ehrlichii]|uniref:TonB-dependent receptor family protein n=1 Tax=Alkalilimnicola ehrlichii TaxID=351052 RepID=UPI0015F27519|nr:TonB-dependent receptor [Alkalilimnicola ehrlichii]
MNKQRMKLRIHSGLWPSLLLAWVPLAAAEIRVTTLSPIEIFSGEVNLAGVPGAGAAVAEHELEQVRPVTVHEILATLPGVVATAEDPLGRRSNIGLRGLNPRRSRKVHLLEDGAPIQLAPYGDSTTHYQPDARRLRGIEVIKGSGAIMYGPQTIGGAVNYLTRNPPLQPEVRIGGAAGNLGYLDAQVSAGGTYGNTGLLVDFIHQQMDGPLRGEEQRINDIMFKSITEFEPGHRLTFKVTALNEHQRGGEAGMTERDYQQDPRRNRLPDDRFTVERVAGQLTHELFLSDRTGLTTNLYANTTERTAWRQTGGSDELANCPDGIDAENLANAADCGNQMRPRDYRVIGIEPRVIHDHQLLGVSNRLVAGARYQKERGVRQQFFGDEPGSRLPACTRLRGGEDCRREVFDVRATALFLQNTSRFGHLRITPGLRLERWELDEVRERSGRDKTTAERQFGELLPGIGLNWDGITGLELFGGVHRGISPPQPAIDERPAPELSLNYELGLRTTPMAPIAAELSVFYIDYDDIIASQSTAEGHVRFNAGRARLRGAELALRIDSWAFHDADWNIYLLTNATLLDTEFRRDVPDEGLVAGNEFPYAPRFSGYLALGFEYGPLDARIGTRHVGEQYVDNANTETTRADGQTGTVPAYTLFDATANYRLTDDLRVFVGGRNLTDREYIANRTDGITPGIGRHLYAGFEAQF